MKLLILTALAITNNKSFVLGQDDITDGEVPEDTGIEEETTDTETSNPS